jgi:hypothetical protein
MRSLKSVIAVMFGVMLLSLPLIASDEQYLLLRNAGQRQLDQAAEKGYRLAFANGNQIIMEKLPEGTTERYSYRLLSTNMRNMERLIDEAAREGFRLHPHAIWITDRVIVIMERNPNHTGKEYEYRFLQNRGSSGLQDEIIQAAKEGYAIVTLRSPLPGGFRIGIGESIRGTPNNKIVIMERERDDNPTKESDFAY